MSWATANYGYWEFWAPYDPQQGFYGTQKCIFDGENKLIYVNPNESIISIKEDVYSGWKEWVSVRDNSKFPPAIRTTGGDPIPGTNQFTGDTYFFINGWRFIIDHSVAIDGVIYSDDFPSPFVQVAGTQIVTNKVSSLVQTVTTESIGGITIPSVQDIRQEMDVNSSKLQLIKEKTDTITPPPTPAAIADAVWDEDLASHTFGAGNKLASLPTKQEIAEQTWQTPLTITLPPGSFGHYIAKKILTVSRFIGLK